MDSKVVNKAIRTEIRPFLKEAGFNKFTGKCSWRYSDIRIDLVNFESFNAYNAAVLECTPFSFQVILGCYFPAIPSFYGKIKEKDGLLMPHYSECLFTLPIKKTLHQPELANEFIWYIDKKGKYLNDAMLDVKKLLTKEGLPWFDQFYSPNIVMERLKKILEGCAKDGKWDFGKNPSPHWCYHAGYVALWLKKYDFALNYLKRIENYGRQDLKLIESIKFAEKQIKKHLGNK